MRVRLKNLGNAKTEKILTKNSFEILNKKFRPPKKHLQYQNIIVILYFQFFLKILRLKIYIAVVHDGPESQLNRKLRIFTLVAMAGEKLRRNESN